ncbi:phosphoglycerate mutase-like protein [Auricularia subglabra TFB-10046 SS5]|nr:phosphoglycerate mutase-like protein [Auricularia subglabra TFB-10046 SS5]
MTARIYLIRHGETNENLTHIIQGQLDTLLNETGFEQARSARDHLQSVPFSIAYSSDSKRTVDTARTILEKQDGVQLHTTEALRERHMGILQGTVWRTHENLHKALPDSVEKPEAFRERLVKWWTTVLVPYVATTLADKPKDAPPVNVLIVSHGAAIAFLLLALLNEMGYTRGPGEDYNSTHRRIHNVSISTIDVHADGSGVLVKVGDVSHLERPVLKTNADLLE